MKKILLNTVAIALLSASSVFAASESAQLSQATVQAWQQPSVEEQIAKYREVYDRAFIVYNEVERYRHGFCGFYEQHVDGLIDILKTGFEVSRHFVNTLSFGGCDYEKNRCFECINELENEAVQVDKKNGMSQVYFISINKKLSELIDRIKEYKSTRNLTYTSFAHSLNRSVDILKSKYVSPGKEVITSYETFFDNVFNPLLVIYTSEALKTDLFVEQAMHPKYPAFLLQFDVTLVKPDYIGKVKPKEKPHFGTFHTTTRMLSHDLGHWNETRLLTHIYNINSIAGFDFQSELKKLYVYCQSLENKDEQTIIKRALFVFVHELNIAFSVEKTSPSGAQTSELIKDVFKKQEISSLAEIIRNRFMKFTDAERSGKEILSVSPSSPFFSLFNAYKIDLRDMEFMLRDLTDSKGIPFLVSFKDRGFSLLEKQAKVREGYERFWNEFINIIKPAF